MNTEHLSTRVDAAIQRVLDEQRIVGLVVLVAVDGELHYRRAAGFADREAGRAMQEDGIFRLASLTKPLVAAAAMSLIENGRMRLDDEVSRYLPDFLPRTADDQTPRISLRHLLTHTAGLSYGFFQPPGSSYERAGVADGISDHGISLAEQLRRIAGVPLSQSPGSAWGYSLAMDVMGAVIARVQGSSLPQAIEALVTAPLGLKDTAFAVRDTARLVVPYADGKPPRRMSDPDVVEFGGISGIRYSPSRALDPQAYPSGGAGMVGTAGEFMKFLQVLNAGGGALLKPQTVRAMMSNQIGALRTTIETTPSWGFGFGGAVLLDPQLAGVPQGQGTWKWGGVYGHHWYVDTRNRLIVACLSNTAVEGMAGPFVTELMAAVYGT